MNLTIYRVIDLLVWFGLVAICFYKARRIRSVEGTSRNPHPEFPKGWWKAYRWFGAFSLVMGCWRLVAYLRVWLS